MIGIHGDTEADQKLWQTYFYWARQRAKTCLPSAEPAEGTIVNDPNDRVSEALSNALQSIVFSAFALEYRLKRTLCYMNCMPKKRIMLKELLDKFWTYLAATERKDRQGKCKAPVNWQSCEDKLSELVTLRNKIAHGNYNEILGEFTNEQDAADKAKELYNAVVEAMMLINIATGYNTRTRDEIEAYFAPLRV